MSDGESSQGFQLDDSGSEGYVETTQAKKTQKKPAAPKAAKAPAKKPAPKKAPLAAKKNAPNDSISETDGGDTFDSPPKKVTMAVDDADAEPASSKPAQKKTASQMYQKLTQLEHVLKRPDTYIGSVEAITQPMWVYDSESKMMALRNTTYVPGFFKIFDEILVNSADNKINDPTMDTIKVNIDREKNQISVYNNGRGIPVERHEKEGVMIPELIFGHLNFDDDQKKLTGGRNGYGAKLANIYSHEFIVETADKVNGKKWKQVFSDNMSKKAAPKIIENKKGEEWTKITFTPDLQRFGMTSIDDDTNALLMKRVYDMAGTVKDIKVYLNDERLKVKGFKQYVEMYLNAQNQAASDAAGGAAVSNPSVIYEVINKRWEVAFALSDGQPQHVSFANSIATTKGGTHVDMIMTHLDQIKKKNKAAPVKPFQVKNHMWIFVNALVENPAFDSQTKECLTLKSSAFGSKCDLSEEFVKKGWSREIDPGEYALFGTPDARISGIVKLEDANNAGGRNAKNCTLILTEGDSAKALAVSGLAVVGRDEYGVFPLRGKLLNVREAGHDQIVKNVEIQHIKQILGLKHNQDYTTTDSLRYGHLMIMTDQDHDGSHIKGLIINFLDHFYPSLLRIPSFLVEFITPIVKVWKGKQEFSFYTMPQYEEWKAANNDGRGWESKYYKASRCHCASLTPQGLGTSTSADAKKYFSDLQKHRLPFEAMQQEDRALIDMAFNKKKADDRKEWLRQFKVSLPISDFVNKELILFSMADNIRSIPSVADGLKPGQRKVLFGCFKRNLTKEIKVAQLAGYVSEKTAYHHGEQSLTATIVGLAQSFVGSNNINLLAPNGQFGTRLAGGKDAASARYIFTNVPRMTRAIFHPADDGLLNYQIEDGMGIEPEYYLPTVPLVLINGADGIGTGWSTAIPNYNPVDIVDNLRRMMKGEEPEKMNPWFRGFKDKYKVSGVLDKVDDHTVEITELPIRKWTQDFKEMLEELTTGTDKTPSTVKEHHTDTTVHFKVHMAEKDMKAAETEGFEKKFKMTTTLGTGNMVCFDLNGKIKRYSSAEEILTDFFHKRLEFYGLRKQHLADELNKQFEKLSNQARFVQMVITRELVVSNKKKVDIVAELRDLKFRPFPKGKKSDVEAEPSMEEDDEGLASDYDYLLGMAIWSLTAEKKLLAERDVKEQELIELLKLSPQDLWNHDLDNFLAEWDADANALKSAKPKTKAAIKAAAKKKRKANGDDSDESDDFVPTKKAAAARPKAKAVIPSPAKASPAKRPSRLQCVESHLTKVYDIPAAKAAPKAKQSTLDGFAGSAKPKPKPAKKPVESDSDDDVLVLPKSKPPAAKAKAKKADSDFEEEDSATARPGRGATKKPAYIDLSEGEDDD
ncbi:DNA topoisomerase 2 [Saitozyma podzolica]|uniref:DNA topoisomerase 2 n=1 Tax=Saitozyma podzolica TaxID=1890683 RepID=A0A427Y811_9TREE|nr:DNA topoisomerase 2 [Saitozyma podzolica]